MAKKQQRSQNTFVYEKRPGTAIVNQQLSDNNRSILVIENLNILKGDS
jgi:hypothetical protein